MIQIAGQHLGSFIWLVDSGCSNHMTGSWKIFQSLDETQKNKVRLGNDKEIKVESKGTIVLRTTDGRLNKIHDVQFVPNMAHNLLCRPADEFWIQCCV